MRIVQLVDSYHPGIESPHPPMGIIEGLAERGHEVEVYTSTVYMDDISLLPPKKSASGSSANIIRSRSFRLGGKIFFPGAIPKILKWEKPDVVHAYIMGSFATLTAGYLKKIKGYPLVVMPDFDIAEPIAPLIKKPYTYAFRRLPTSMADVILAFTQEQKIELTRRFGFDESKIDVLPIGIHSEKFLSKPKRDLRRELGLEDKFVILSICFLIEKKNIELAFKGLQKVENKNVVFIHGGGTVDKGYEEKLRAMTKALKIEDRVRFLGPISHEDVPEYFKMADVYLQTGFKESFCIPILEAMASGLPVITTNVGIASEVIKNGETGFIINNERDIGERIEALAENAELRKKMGKNCKKVARGYDWKMIINRLEKIYRRVMED